MSASGSDGRPDKGSPRLTIALDPRSVWRATWVVLGTLGVVAALGFIWSMNGQAVTATPTPAAAPENT